MHHRCSTLCNHICPCQQFITAFCAPSVFHLHSTFFALVNNLLWHLVPYLCSTFFNLICPYSTIYAPSVFHLVSPDLPLFDLFHPCLHFIVAFCAPPIFHLYLTFFALVNNLLWHFVPHLCSTFFALVSPFSPLSTIYCGIWCLTCVPPSSTFFTLIQPSVPHLYSTLSLFHLICPDLTFFTLVYTLLWHFVPHQRSTFI